MRNPPLRRSRAAAESAQSGESTKTIVVALAANLAIACAKLVAGIISRSTAMFAESAHSLADSINEVLLAISLRRARVPADSTHPLGHGRERFLWAFMAAVASFLIGGCVSILMAIRELEHPTPARSHTAAWWVLAISFVAEGISWIQSMRQAQHAASDRERPVWRHLLRSSEPIVRAIVVEDSAALFGLIIAASGLLAAHLTGSSTPDAIASLLIGVLLAITAFGLARPLADFLIGRSLAQEQLDELHAILIASPAVEDVIHLQAVYTGPEEVIVAAKLHPSSSITVAQLAEAMDDLDQKLRAESPFVADVFLDLTNRRSEPVSEPARIDPSDRRRTGSSGREPIRP